MPSKLYVRTYGRTQQNTKKTVCNYFSNKVSPVKVTEASTAIDALFKKNIRKRDTSPDNRNVVKKKARGRPRKNISDLSTFEHDALLNSDSLNVNVNSTFDNLLQGPVYNQVNICNKSSLYKNISTDTSNSNVISDKVQSPYNVRKIRKKNYAALHSNGIHTDRDKSVLPNGKIKKRKRNQKKLKHAVKNAVINISDTTVDLQNISKKLHSYLDKSVNYSLVIDKQLKPTNTSRQRLRCARKFTPIASNSKLLPLSSVIKKRDSTVFRKGFRDHLMMRAINDPRFFHSSTPIPCNSSKIHEKLNVSPITASAKKRLNFTANNSKSLFESKNPNDISSIQNTVNNSVNKNGSVILINSTVSEIVPNNIENVHEKITIDTTADSYKENNIHSNSLIANDVKLNEKAVVMLEKHLNVLELNGNTNLECQLTEPKRTDIKNKVVPVVLLERLSVPKYLKNRTLFVNTRHRNSLKDSQISSRSQSLIDELSCTEPFKVKSNKTEKISTPRICIEQCNSTKFDKVNDYEESISNKISVRRKSKRISTSSLSNTSSKKSISKSRISDNSKSRLRSSENFSDNDQNTNKCRNSKKNSRLPTINSIELENSSRSMFVSHNSDIVENSIVLPNPKLFITTRKEKVQFNIEPVINNHELKENTKPPNINFKTWDRFSQCKVSLVRMEDCKELNKYSKLFKINDNRVSGRRTHANVVHDNVNRKSIYLKPGKKWFRSLSILRRTNFHEIDDEHFNKGRKWRDSIIEVLDNQNDGAFNKIGNESVVSDMKHTKRSTRVILGIRKSLKIVNISIKDSSDLAIESVSFQNKSGYVSTLANVSVLESFDKLSLSTNVDEREETARQIILKRCGQTDPIPFDDCYSSRTLKKCRKIGEGVYGEVFMYKSLDNKCRVMKVIPIEGNLAVNGEHQKKFEEIISEIIIASELSNLRINNEFCTNGFAELQQIYCVQGKYPQHLLDLWDLFDEERGSENDSPEIFTEDQLYIILELENGGQDLEAYRFNNAEQSYALFVQVVCSLAVAESALQFEHRDMHWGNILISPTDETTTTFRLKGREFEVATKGVKVSIIDFTLSRMTYNNCCIYNDLALDPDLFTATGDYQFDIYRLMKQRNLNDWQTFEPYTNILWLDYTLEKMISHVRYLRETTKTHKTCIRRLSQIRKKILNYNSATELLNSDVFSHVFL